MTKEEIKKEIEVIKDERDYNIANMIANGNYLKALMDEFAKRAMELTKAYAGELIDKLNKLLEATNDD